MGYLKNRFERRLAAEQEARADQPVVITIAVSYTHLDVYKRQPSG